MHSSGVIFSRWKLSEKMMRAQRCMRQNSMPISFSGDFAKCRSQSSISQYRAQPSPQNGVPNIER
jgi:hypothetical protein